MPGGAHRQVTVRVLFVALALLAPSCGNATVRDVAPADDGGRYGSGVDTDFATEDPAAKPPSQTATAAPLSGRPLPPQTHPGPPQPGPPITERSTPADRLGVGNNALFYLRGDPHSKLIVEINAVAGYEPRPSALDILRARLEGVLDKPGGIEIVTNSFESNKETYSRHEIEALEEKLRKNWSDREGPDVTMHILYLNGRQSGDYIPLGIALRASSIVIYKEQIDARSDPLFGAEQVEAAVLVHEVGHLLGLVNIGYRSPRPHEDPQHKGHSVNKNSVMYWAIESRDITAVFNEPPPNDYDADDKADLEDRRTGRL